MASTHQLKLFFPVRFKTAKDWAVTGECGFCLSFCAPKGYYLHCFYSPQRGLSQPNRLMLIVYPFKARKLRKVATPAEVLRLYLRGTTPGLTKNTFIWNLTL